MLLAYYADVADAHRDAEETRVRLEGYNAERREVASGAEMTHRRWTLAWLVAALSAVAACGRDTYQPFYYPNPSDLTRYTAGLVYSTEAEARQWVRQRAAERRDREWDHEIGKNCQSQTGTNVRICEDTFK